MTSAIPHPAQSRLHALSAALLAARIARRWTQQDLARRLGVTRRTVQNLENGDPGVRIGTVLDAMNLLGLEVVSAFDGEHRLPAKRRVYRKRAAERDPLDF